MTLIIEGAIGFMLKVLKNGFDIAPFKNDRVILFNHQQSEILIAMSMLSNKPKMNELLHANNQIEGNTFSVDLIKHSLISTLFGLRGRS